MTHIEKILCFEPRGVISFVGAGGKTSLMFHLAGLLAQSGQRVLSTTTTKIFVPTPEQSDTVFVDCDPKMILRLAHSGCQSTSHVTAVAAHLAGSGKLKGFKPEDIDTFEESGLFDWILVEADGAAGCPLKVPAGHEPVIPSKTNILVSVAGLDVIGKPLSEQTVCRSALAGKLMGLAEGEIITESALACLYIEPSAQFSKAPSNARRFIFLNKADNPDRIEAGERIAGQIRLACNPVAEALIVGQALGQIIVHSVHPLDSLP